MERQTIMVCDDDQAIVEAIEVFLTEEGYEVVKAFDGDELLQKLEDRPVHLVLLDVMMPKLNGLATTRKIREEKNIPIILVSAKSEDTDKIIGLNFGADDYVTKPFNPLELMARVKSQLRRYTQLGSVVTDEHLLMVGGLVLDRQAMEVSIDGELVSMTPKEFGILEFLMTSPGRVYTIDQIYEHVWQEAAFEADNTVAVHIRHIREKIEINPKEPKYLKVVWGIGYKIEKLAV